MMTIGEANDLLTPYLQHPDFKKLESKTPMLQELTTKIQEEIKKIDMNHHLFGQYFVRINEQTEQLFREFATICKQSLK